MFVRGIRGASVVAENTAEAILSETQLLLSEMMGRNGVAIDDIASVFFSLTMDLNAEFPAIAARQMGLRDVPLLCMNEVSVPGALPHCLRILIHWNTDRLASEIVHPYLKDAVLLRPDRVPS
ncbi:chorismate mutase [bacterium]|nr:chorismate mutase [bacterium]